MIRMAEKKDTERILYLLTQVNKVHHDGRPDIFNLGTKYTNEELNQMFTNPLNPIFVYTNEEDVVLGYAFCITQCHPNDNILTPIKSLYIDDLCVDECSRGKGVGTALYHHVCAYAKEKGYYNVTLNVWELNASARRFYEHLGLKPLKTYMENIL